MNGRVNLILKFLKMTMGTSIFHACLFSHSVEFHTFVSCIY